MRGCLGCLGLLVVLALLAWPIEELQQVFGWSDAQTGYLLLLVLGLLVIGGAGRRQPPRRPASATHPVEAAGRREAPARRAARVRPTSATDQARYARRTGTPAGRAVPRARDPLPAQLRFSVLQRDGFRCRYCGRPGTTTGVVLHVDHLVPLAAGGSTNEDNLLTACEECNLGKGARAVVVEPKG